MKIDITKRLPEVDEAIARTTNPWHLAIINNYIRHANLEVCGWYDQLLRPDLMVEHPVYRLHMPDGLRVLDGKEEVCKYYEGLSASGATVFFHTDGQLLVDDYGFMTEYTSHNFWPGASLQAFGADVDDPGAFYVLSCPIAQAWPFDDKLRVAGERAYVGPYTIRKCDPAEVVTVEECRQKLAIPPTITPSMVRRSA